MTVLYLLLIFASQAFAWHDQTHLAICKAAGFDNWYSCAGPDIAKLKAGDIEAYNHWFNNTAEVEITPQMVMKQIARYNKDNISMDKEGHLAGGDYRFFTRVRKRSSSR